MIKTDLCDVVVQNSLHVGGIARVNDVETRTVQQSLQ